MGEHRRHITAVAIAFMIVLAGCAGDDGTGTATDRTETTTVTTTAHPHPTTVLTESSSAPTTTSEDGDRTDTDASEWSPTESDTGENNGGDGSDGTDGATDDVESLIDGGETRSASVVRVIDGDTIEVEFENGETDTVRLLGVDTPETRGEVSPDEFGFENTVAAREHLRDSGYSAHHYVEERDGGDVRIVTDPESDRRGSFDRLLAYVYVDGTNLNAELLKRGYARHYESEFSLNDAFAAHEDTARDSNRGVWDFSQPAEPEPEPTEFVDRDCGDFDSHEEAQAFFEANNPDEDPHRLDANGDGVACESI